jgi:hypothetical protein
MALRQLLTQTLRRAPKSSARCMTTYPIDESVFGLTDDQQQVIDLFAKYCSARISVYTLACQSLVRNKLLRQLFHSSCDKPFSTLPRRSWPPSPRKSTKRTDGKTNEPSGERWATWECWALRPTRILVAPAVHTSTIA